MSTDTDPWASIQARIAELEAENQQLRGGRTLSGVSFTATFAGAVHHEPRSCDTVELDRAFAELQVAARDFAWNGGDECAEALAQQAVEFVIKELETQFPDVAPPGTTSATHITLVEAIEHLHTKTLDGRVAQLEDGRSKETT